MTQLTGFSDPVYAEAYVNVNQYDIVLDVLVVNQTNDTLQNLTIELATLGKLVYSMLPFNTKDLNTFKYRNCFNLMIFMTYQKTCNFELFHP